MQAHVIMCNDYPDVVVLGTDEDAEKERKRREKISRKEHGDCGLFWHVRTVGLIDKR